MVTLSDTDRSLDAVLRALADPTRRRLLRVIAERPGVTTGELPPLAATMTRWGVMKHLSVLRAARLVQTLYDGRRRRHYHDPGSLQLVRDWLDEMQSSTRSSG